MLSSDSGGGQVYSFNMTFPNTPLEWDSQSYSGFLSNEDVEKRCSYSSMFRRPESEPYVLIR